ncbi:Hypothetical protein MYEA_5270 [Mycoplasma yeatsii 13926]|uniref:Uncharacterized protein n=1 Tax=Mycoplasma yeatsii 13926 TaxID=1188240 RepID=S6G3G5_9MOLU|nr:hypothetical protein [Mycoplasma yeatsii]EOA07161.1 Hypothetical protein MYEA_5270 [Mycoplasma yeatsii 13926]
MVIKIIFNIFRVLAWILFCLVLFVIGVALLSFNTKTDYVLSLPKILQESNWMFFIDSAKESLAGKSLKDIWSLDFQLLNHKIGAVLIFYILPIFNVIYITLSATSLFLWRKKRNKAKAKKEKATEEAKT